jgi:excinuclease ABC subunit B
VSCIYGIGDPEDYKNSMIVLRVNQQLDRDVLLEKLVSMQFTRNNVEFARGTFRVKGDVVEIIPTYESTNAVRVEFFDDVIERIREVDVVSGQVLKNNELVTIFPATHFVTNETKKEEAIQRIEDELVDQIAKFKAEGKLLEAQRIEQRTRYDIEMIKEIGSCSGVENYSRHLSLRAEGETPSTLMDFFGDDYLLVVDESHVSLPQVRGMYNGDRSRKQTLVDYGFRLPSALDNRPLKFDEFNEKIKQVIYVSATPGDYEVERCGEVVQQIIRPTGLLDQNIEVRPSKNQIDNLIKDIRTCVSKNERVLVTTLTIKMSEDLTAYLKETGIKVTYLHSEIKSLERIELIRSLRLGIYDVIVGINLLREGLDLPEVSLICILDADKEGFLRSERALIQTIGRAARNVNGKVIMYADKVTDSMRKAIEETYRRREIQNTHNVVNNIVPQTIVKSVRDSISISKEIDLIAEEKGTRKLEELTKFEKRKLLDKLEKEMKEAAKNLEFERAATLRDVIFEIKAGI